VWLISAVENVSKTIEIFDLLAQALLHAQLRHVAAA
jgi:hypothetical protein